VTLIQRFGSALNLNIHFLMLFLDGVYVDAGVGESDELKAPYRNGTTAIDAIIYFHTHINIFHIRHFFHHTIIRSILRILPIHHPPHNIPFRDSRCAIRFYIIEKEFT
jgi:hypothetical protein